VRDQYCRSPLWMHSFCMQHQVIWYASSAAKDNIRVNLGCRSVTGGLTSHDVRFMNRYKPEHTLRLRCKIEKDVPGSAVSVRTSDLVQYRPSVVQLERCGAIPAVRW
jgi:hypothetical protein